MIKKIFQYTIFGKPIAVARSTDTGTPRMWDDYKHKKLNYKIDLQNQHDEQPIIDGPVLLDIIFHMPIRPIHKQEELLRQKHSQTPSIFALFNFCEHALLGIVLKHDCQIVQTSLIKKYANKPRTEITIRRLKQ